MTALLSPDPSALPGPGWLEWYLVLAASVALLLFARKRQLPALVVVANVSHALLAPCGLLLGRPWSPALGWAAVAAAGGTLGLLVLDELLRQLSAIRARGHN